MILKSRAPVRIPFGGGATDMSPYTETHGGMVISTTINKYVYATLKTRKDKKVIIKSIDYKKTQTFHDITKIKPEKDLALIKACIKRMNPQRGFELSIRSDVPPNTGLGSSASVAIATLGILNQLKTIPLNKYELAELAYKIEDQDIQNKGGRQDQYASSWGGFNLIQFNGNDNVKVTPLPIKKDTLMELEKSTLLAYIGKRGESGKIQNILIKQQQSYKKKDTIKRLDKIKQLCHQQHKAILHGNINKFAQLLEEGWQQKRKLNPSITNKKIDNYHNTAIRAGAIAAKVIGAGGAGHMIIICKSDKEHQVTKKLEQAGAKIVDFSFEQGGLQIWRTN